MRSRRMTYPHGFLVLRRPVRPSLLEVCNVEVQDPIQKASHHSQKASSVEWTKHSGRTSTGPRAGTPAPRLIGFPVGPPFCGCRGQSMRHGLGAKPFKFRPLDFGPR
jgi:hypothetical protein